MPLKGLTGMEAAWLKRRVRALGSLDAVLHALVLNGRRAEDAARLLPHALKPPPSTAPRRDTRH